MRLTIASAAASPGLTAARDFRSAAGDVQIGRRRPQNRRIATTLLR